MDATNVSELLDYWEKVRGRTRRVADCIPEDKLEWTWKAGKFSPGDILRHLAGIERWMFGENVQGKQSSIPGTDRSSRAGWRQSKIPGRSARGRDGDLPRADGRGSHAQVRDPEAAPISIGRWLRLMAEHEIHHREQPSGLDADVPTPPIYGLTSSAGAESAAGEIEDSSLLPSPKEEDNRELSTENLEPRTLNFEQ